MWSKTNKYTYSGVSIREVWDVMTDVNNWHTWQDDIDYAKINGKFEAGNHFIIKVKGGPKFTIKILQVESNKSFTDLTKLPFARMYGTHEFNINTNSELEIITTIKVTGILSFFWRKLIAEKIANGDPQQTESLIKRTLYLKHNNKDFFRQDN